MKGSACRGLFSPGSEDPIRKWGLESLLVYRPHPFVCVAVRKSANSQSPQKFVETTDRRRRDDAAASTAPLIDALHGVITVLLKAVPLGPTEFVSGISRVGL